jgi:peptidoglycan LD-endopeptidase LytH
LSGESIASGRIAPAQRRATRIVRWVMQTFILPTPRTRAVALVVLATLATGCARPVLYYPTPESAGARSAPRAASRPAESAPAEGGRPIAAYDESAAADMEYLEERHLLVPVAGADMSKVDDSFYADRDGGERTHHALDILAPRGTPILSADDGKILRMSNSSLGGICMYTVDPAGRIVYYYAHMDHYNDAMTPGRTIAKGDTLGYVGTTGNAPKDTPHLHFQIMRWAPDGKYWNGEPIDPFELLGGVPRRGVAGR